jgi:hypothetical protein
MLPDVSKYVVRDPRYLAADEAEVDIRVVRCADESDAGVLAKLIDFSRRGMQFLTATQYDHGEPLYVHLRDGQSDFEVRLEGTVQWQRSAEGNAFSIGCQFQEEVDWATLGELFLCGILNRETAV